MTTPQAAQSKLFTPLKLGAVTLQQRIAMAPMTRFRADASHVPLPFVSTYYAQRASVPGTLLITEGVFISPRSGGYPNVPGIYNAAQIAAWRKVTDAVHAKGSYIFLQLWSLGRTANPQALAADGFEVVSSSPVPLDPNSKSPPPKELSVSEIKDVVGDFAQAARNAIEAGFDGVEIHGANGYLVDQFIQDNVNKRTDAYGGSVENRSRFGLEVAKAVVDAVGAERVGIRLSPFSDFQGMRMADPVPQFTHLLKGLKELKLAYIHVVESRVSGNADIESTDKVDFVVQTWDNTSPVLIAGGFRTASSLRAVDEEYPNNDVVIAFGRPFLATPDLVYRVKHGIEFNHQDRDTFYKATSEDGYIDYPFSNEFEQASKL